MGYLWWVYLCLVALLLLRFGLRFLAIDPSNPFTGFLYALADFFLYPFQGVVPVVPSLAFGPGGMHSLEWTTLIALGVYTLHYTLARQFLRITISSPRERSTDTLHVHSAGPGGPGSDSPAGLPAERKSDKLRIGSPLPPLGNAASRIESRETHTDDIVPSARTIDLEELPLVNQEFGNYTLVRLLGQGGYASVYLGVHRYLHTSVALKLLQPSLASSHELQRFQVEARTLARLRHRHIVRVLDFGWEENTPFIAMEYAPGGTLHDYFSPQLPLPVRAILPFVQQAASALQYIHQHGLIHCDVKPENVLLGPANKVWLADFGTVESSAEAGGNQIIENEFAGTPGYLAPERIEGRPLPASDQYALAVMVYQWLCGREPFQGTVLQVCLQHLEQPPPRLRDLVPSISPAVERVVLRGLAKDPRSRFAHVQEFAFALKHAYQGMRFPMR